MSTNRRIADIAARLYDSCTSHILNLEIKRMFENNNELHRTVSSVSSTICAVRYRLQNAGVLRNPTDSGQILSVK